eukprot:UN15415
MAMLATVICVRVKASRTFYIFILSVTCFSTHVGLRKHFATILIS